jgi:hypothetical protein
MVGHLSPGSGETDMAFTGAAVIKKISDNIYRITGLSLGIGANGTIGLGENAAAAVKLLGTGWNRYETVGQHGGQVELDESVQCDVISADAAARRSRISRSSRLATVRPTSC